MEGSGVNHKKYIDRYWKFSIHDCARSTCLFFYCKFCNKKQPHTFSATHVLAAMFEKIPVNLTSPNQEVSCYHNKST